jgi:hypothetical protein
MLSLKTHKLEETNPDKHEPQTIGRHTATPLYNRHVTSLSNPNFVFRKYGDPLLGQEGNHALGSPRRKVWVSSDFSQTTLGRMKTNQRPY